MSEPGTRWALAGLVVALLSLAGCGPPTEGPHNLPPDTHTRPPAARIEKIRSAVYWSIDPSKILILHKIANDDGEGDMPGQILFTNDF